MEKKRRRDSEGSHMMSDFKITENTEESEFVCTAANCILCAKGLPPCLSSNYTTWYETLHLLLVIIESISYFRNRKDIAKVILFSMQNSKANQEYFHLKFDIYPFIMSHSCLMTIIQPKILSNFHSSFFHCFSVVINSFY